MTDKELTEIRKKLLDEHYILWSDERRVDFEIGFNEAVKILKPIIDELQPPENPKVVRLREAQAAMDSAILEYISSHMDLMKHAKE
jgi:hypothetical protein